MVHLAKPDRPPARNYSSRREQWRLLLLIVPLGLVIILMGRLRDPETADRVNQFFAPVENDDPIKPRPLVAEPAIQHDAHAAHGSFPDVRADLLPAIKDNTYFRNAETDAWFHFLELLQRIPPEQIASARSIAVDYVQLVDQPHFYRGKLVTIEGWLRQVTEQTPAENDLGLESYYRVVIQPADGAGWPILAYCLERPADLPGADGLTPNAKVTGLFFKNLSYRWQDGLGTAPVIVAKRIEPIGDGSETMIDRPSVRKKAHGAEDAAHPGTFPEILSLAGWDAERLAQFDDGEPLSDDQRGAALDLLWRLRSFDSASLADWAHEPLASDRVVASPDEYRGQLMRLAGRVTNVVRHTPAPADAERLEMAAYYECDVALDDDAGAATILAARVPSAWLRMDELDEPVTAIALYLKRPASDDTPAAVWLAKELAWHPTVAREPDVPFGQSVLGTLGMDVGLLDQIASRGRIRATEREAFYQMLDAAGQIGSHQLLRFAEGNLAATREAWERELAHTKEDARRALAQQVVRRAAEGRYSVAPLFNAPQEQIGRLVVVEGVARRVVRVEVGRSPDGELSDVARRFGIDHYYEMQVFTDDSQNYPLVFCVRELPEGFPTGGSLHVPVRVAGFFFKNWLYQTRGSGQAESAGRGQYAPMLVGRGPVVLAMEQGGAAVTHWVLGGLFLLALAGIVAAAAWSARGDRRFRASVLAAHFSLPAGQSLNELNLPAGEVPMNIPGPLESSTSERRELQ